MDIPIIFFVGTRSRQIELSRELNCLVLSVKKDCLLQVNQRKFLSSTNSERGTIAVPSAWIMCVFFCTRRTFPWSLSYSYSRFSTKVVTWVIFIISCYGVVDACHKWAQSLLGARVHAYFPSCCHRVPCLRLPWIQSSFPIPYTAVPAAALCDQIADLVPLSRA